MGNTYEINIDSLKESARTCFISNMEVDNYLSNWAKNNIAKDRVLKYLSDELLKVEKNNENIDIKCIYMSPEMFEFLKNILKDSNVFEEVVYKNQIINGIFGYLWHLEIHVVEHTAKMVFSV